MTTVQLCLCNILNIYCHFNNLHSIFNRSTFHLKKPLSLTIHKNNFLSIKVYHEMAATQSGFQVSDLILKLLLFPPSAVITSIEVLKPQSYSWGLKLTSFPPLLLLLSDLFPWIINPQMTSRIRNIFFSRKDFFSTEIIRWSQAS